MQFPEEGWSYRITPGNATPGAELRKELRRRPPKNPSVTRTGTTALTLSEEIRQRFDEFSRSQKDVGQYIVDHLEEAAFHTAEELARRANTSSSTVVRFAQALGFEGFPELQAAARDEYRRARENGAPPADITGPPLFPIDQTEFETALAADHANVAETARKIDRDEVAAAVDLISRADRIVLCGTDQMAFFASYLRHLLMLLDLRAEVVASPSQEGLAKLGRVDDKTVMVGLLRRPPAPARGPRDEARPQPARGDDRDSRRHPVRGREARRPPALLLVEQPGIRAFARGTARADPGARLRRLRARRVGLRGPHQGVSAEVGRAARVSRRSAVPHGAVAVSGRLLPVEERLRHRCALAGAAGRGRARSGRRGPPGCDPIDPAALPAALAERPLPQERPARAARLS